MWIYGGKGSLTESQESSSQWALVQKTTKLRCYQQGNFCYFDTLAYRARVTLATRWWLATVEILANIHQKPTWNAEEVQTMENNKSHG